MSGRSDDEREAVFDAFVVGSSERLLRFAQLLTGDRGRAEDLVQDAYAKAYLRWGGIRSDDPWAYVRRCVLNGNNDWWRRKPWREQSTTPLPDTRPVADHAHSHAERDAVFLALAGLTRRERTVVVLRYYQDLSEAEIATVLGISPGTVKSTAMRALRKLRSSPQLQPESIEEKP